MFAHVQKVCDVYDLFVPEIDEIIRKDLRATPFGSRRLWEFAMIFHILRRDGALHPQSRGLAMGAGREHLIYAIAPRIAETVVTDLYGEDAGWEATKTASPKQLLAEKAPPGTPLDTVVAHSMDMRNITYPDEHFDFCWSTGAFEHIGRAKDFDTHLREVHRVLKPGGIYVFTTVVNFNGRTIPAPHNYLFHPADLAKIVNRSPLCPNEVFDCGIEDHLFNRPHSEDLEDYGHNGGSYFTRPIVSFRRGYLVAANTVVLRKSPKSAACRVENYKETALRLRRHSRQYLNRHWRKPQIIATFESEGFLKTKPQFFGQRTMRFTLMRERKLDDLVVMIDRTNLFAAKAEVSFDERRLPNHESASFELEADDQHFYTFRIRATDQTLILRGLEVGGAGRVHPASTA